MKAAIKSLAICIGLCLMGLATASPPPVFAGSSSPPHRPGSSAQKVAAASARPAAPLPKPLVLLQALRRGRVRHVRHVRRHSSAHNTWKVVKARTAESGSVSLRGSPLVVPQVDQLFGGEPSSEVEEARRASPKLRAYAKNLRLATLGLVPKQRRASIIRPTRAWSSSHRAAPRRRCRKETGL